MSLPASHLYTNKFSVFGGASPTTHVCFPIPLCRKGGWGDGAWRQAWHGTGWRCGLSAVYNTKRLLCINASKVLPEVQLYANHVGKKILSGG